MPENLDRERRILGWSAAAGFAAWNVLGAAVHARWTTLGLPYGLQLNITGIFLVGPLVTTPLALLLARPDGDGGARAWREAARYQPVAALGVLLSFFAKTGNLAMALTAPWVLLGALAALSAAGRFLENRFSRPDELAMEAGLAMLPVGGLWLAASRWGAMPMGFEEPTVLLTAVHFHFAGLAACVSVGCACRWARRWRLKSRPLILALSAGVVAGVPLLAAGIASRSMFEVVAAMILAFSLGGFCLVSLFVIVPRLPGAAARVLLAIALGSAVVSMHYAGHYAASVARKVASENYSIPRMATVHGLLNALGFSLCGLLAWVAAERAGRAKTAA